MGENDGGDADQERVRSRRRGGTNRVQGASPRGGSLVGRGQSVDLRRHLEAPQADSWNTNIATRNARNHGLRQLVRVPRDVVEIDVREHRLEPGTLEPLRQVVLTGQSKADSPQNRRASILWGRSIS